MTYYRTHVSMHVMFIVVHTLAGSWQSYGVFVLETVAILIVLALGAWAIVRFGGSRFVVGKGGSRMRVVERLSLEPKRSLYLVEVDGKNLLVGVSEGAVQLVEHLPGEPEPNLENQSTEGSEER